MLSHGKHQPSPLQAASSPSLIFKVSAGWVSGLLSGPNSKTYGALSLNSRAWGLSGPTLDLCQGELVGAAGVFDLQLEGVFVGVVLHDVVVHVHQDPFFALLKYFPNLVMGDIILV